jgi:hypothetical protein
LSNQIGGEPHESKTRPDCPAATPQRKMGSEPNGPLPNETPKALNER